VTNVPGFAAFIAATMSARCIEIISRRLLLKETTAIARNVLLIANTLIRGDQYIKTKFFRLSEQLAVAQSIPALIGGGSYVMCSDLESQCVR